MTALTQKSVLLIIGGGIAAYKSLELIRLLRGKNIAVRVVMSKAAEEFVTPLSVAALSGHEVRRDLFDATAETAMGHIELSRSADLIVVAPATADLMAKMAHGLAGDLASTLLLASNKPVMIAPAMNVVMWQHPATQRNLSLLQGDGVQVIGPGIGDMACGETGPGRMAEPAEILAAVEARLSSEGALPLKGKKIVITAGPTREPIDPVRYISNHSSGKQGYAIAAAVAALGGETILISGPVTLPLPVGVKLVKVETAQEMLAACEAALPCDVAIGVAAVADWRVAQAGEHKLKKDAAGLPQLALVENPDILQYLAKHKTLRPELVIGFAAETDNLLAHAQKKLKAKGCDLILANDVGAGTDVFNGERNHIHLISASAHEDWGDLSKTEVAQRLAALIANWPIARDRQHG